jgi:predicted ATP-dependent serine protease
MKCKDCGRPTKRISGRCSRCEIGETQGAIRPWRDLIKRWLDNGNMTDKDIVKNIQDIFHGVTELDAWRQIAKLRRVQ